MGNPDLLYTTVPVLTPASGRVRFMQLARYPNCKRCGTRATTVAYLVPPHRGGNDAPSNLRSLCGECDVSQAYHGNLG